MKIKLCSVSFTLIRLFILIKPHKFALLRENKLKFVIIIINYLRLIYLYVVYIPITFTNVEIIFQDILRYKITIYYNYQDCEFNVFEYLCGYFIKENKVRQKRVL